MVILSVPAATFAVSFLAFTGALILAQKEELRDTTLVKLVGFSAGAFVGGAYLHPIPETVSRSSNPQLHEKKSIQHVLISFGSLLLGVVLMLLLKIGLAHQHGRVGQAVGVSQLWNWSQTHSYDMVRQHVLHE